MGFRVVTLLILLFTSINIFAKPYDGVKFNIEKVKLGNHLVLPQLGVIKQDDLGYIWFSSSYNLYRFDGNNLKEFKMDFPIHKLPYEEKTINDFEFDSYGNIWLATARGLVYFLVEEERFCFFENTDLHLSDFSMKVLSVEEINPGNIVFNTTDELYHLRFADQKRLIEGSGLDLTNIKDSTLGKITCIEKVNSNHIWLGGQAGICKLSGNLQFESVIKWPTEKYPKSNISSIFEDSDGTIWIGTKGNGLWIHKPDTEILTKIDLHNSLNIVYQITESNHKIFYATLGGIGVINKKDLKKDRENTALKSKKLLQEKMMISVFTDKSGVVWCGSILKGIYKLYADSPFYKISYPENVVNLMPFFNNLAIIEKDAKGDIWSFDKGYFRKRKKQDLKNVEKIDFGLGILSCRYFKVYDNKLFVALNKGLEVFDLNSLKPDKDKYISLLKSYSNNRTYSEFVRDSNGNFWFLEKTGELSVVYKHETDAPKTILKKNTSFVESSNVLFTSSDGKVWLSMIHSGLLCYDPETKLLQKFNLTEKTIDTDEFLVSCMLEDSDKNIWFGTHNGILKWSEKNKLEWIKESKQLMVFSLDEDLNGNILGTSQSHIFRLNKQTKIIENFELEGVNEDVGFFTESHVKMSDNQFIYPLTNGGLIEINPSLIPLKSTIPEVIISEIKIHNINLEKDKAIYGKKILSKDIPYLTMLNLKYYQKNLSFGFIGLDYHKQDEIIYEFKLDGIDTEWNRRESGVQFVNYSNLDPGEYNFKVRASYNGDFTNSPVRELKVFISQAWWKTAPAYMVYLVIILIVIYYIWRYTLERVLLKEQLKLERFQSKKEKELNQAKLEFFTNISHEFKTPLSLLIGPLNKLIRNNMEETERKKLYSLMFRNADRLLRLINQIMDFRKVAKGSLKLKVIHDNLSFYIQNIFNYFIDAASQKNIDFKLNCDPEISVWFDPDIIEKITSNLIFNAIKYTNAEGYVTVTINRFENEIQITIEDSGIGIHAEDLENIFDRFYRVDNKKTAGEKAGGTGIGLALTKQLVELHKGRIEVESKPGKGSKFTVYIGCQKELFNHDQLVLDKIKSFVQEDVDLGILTSEANLTEKIEQLNEAEITTSKAKLLLVEDDYDLRKFLREFFKTNYNVFEADNGEKGLKLALEKAPDIIVSDVMMPIMNGLEFCKNVKENMAISHLPVVLLTAKTKIEHQIEGLETGADAYVAKPFDPHYLEVVIRKLIDTRIHLREKFDRKFVELTTDEMKLTNADQHFLDKVIKIIEDNISNTEFRMEDVYTQLGLGRTHFHNKMKAITNQTGGDFIRTVRLKRAAYLLKNHKIRVSDVCYDVGFSDPKYFGKVFRKYFGVSPREYSKTQGENTTE